MSRRGNTGSSFGNLQLLIVVSGFDCFGYLWFFYYCHDVILLHSRNRFASIANVTQSIRYLSLESELLSPAIFNLRKMNVQHSVCKFGSRIANAERSNASGTMRLNFP